jgi:hypothetical protein
VRRCRGALPHMRVGSPSVARPGTDKRPGVVRVRSVSNAQKIVSICDEHGWKLVAGVEPEEVVDLSDFDMLIEGTAQKQLPVGGERRVGRNEPCLCGNGKKFKKCCGRDGGPPLPSSPRVPTEDGAASFIPIGLEEYVEMRIAANPGEAANDLRGHLQAMVDLVRSGRRCACGRKPWALGSAAAGLACFTCITGEATPSGDYELVEVIGTKRPGS